MITDKKSEELEEINQKYKPHHSPTAWANGYHPIIVDGAPEKISCDST